MKIDFSKNKKFIIRKNCVLCGSKSLKEVLNFHKGLAINYIEYNKVYLTYKLFDNTLSIYNDSFNEILLKSIKYKNKEGQVMEKVIDKFFPPLQFD